jgi:periplasmic protein CpxP/Spy
MSGQAGDSDAAKAAQLVKRRDPAFTFLCKSKETVGRFPGLVLSEAKDGLATQKEDRKLRRLLMTRERTLGRGKAGLTAATAAGVLGAFLMLFFVWGAASAYQYAGGQRHHGWGNKSPDQMVDRHLEMLSKRLNLTDDQKAKVKPLLENEFKQMQDLRQNSSLSREDKRAKFREIRESTNSQIRSLLNSDQQKSFDEWQQQMKERRGMREKRGGNAPENPKQ